MLIQSGFFTKSSIPHYGLPIALIVFQTIIHYDNAAILHLRPNKSEGIVDRNCKININEACRNSIRNARPVHAAHIALKQLNSLGVMQAQYFTG